MSFIFNLSLNDQPFEILQINAIQHHSKVNKPFELKINGVVSEAPILFEQPSVSIAFTLNEQFFYAHGYIDHCILRKIWQQKWRVELMIKPELSRLISCFGDGINNNLTLEELIKQHLPFHLDFRCKNTRILKTTRPYWMKHHQHCVDFILSTCREYGLNAYLDHTLLDAPIVITDHLDTAQLNIVEPTFIRLQTEDVSLASTRNVLVAGQRVRLAEKAHCITESHLYIKINSHQQHHATALSWVRLHDGELSEPIAVRQQGIVEPVVINDIKSKGQYDIKAPIDWQQGDWPCVGSRHLMQSGDVHSHFPHATGSVGAMLFAFDSPHHPVLLGALNSEQNPAGTHKEHGNDAVLRDHQNNALIMQNRGLFTGNLQQITHRKSALSLFTPAYNPWGQNSYWRFGDSVDSGIAGIYGKTDGGAINRHAGNVQTNIGQGAYRLSVDSMGRQTQEVLKTNTYQQHIVTPGARYSSCHDKNNVHIHETARQKREIITHRKTNIDVNVYQESTDSQRHLMAYQDHEEDIHADTISTEYRCEQHHTIHHGPVDLTENVHESTLCAIRFRQNAKQLQLSGKHFQLTAKGMKRQAKIAQEGINITTTTGKHIREHANKRLQQGVMSVFTT